MDQIGNGPPGLAVNLYPGTGLVYRFQRQVAGVARPLAGWGATLVAYYPDGSPAFETLSTAGPSPAITIDEATNTGYVTIPAVVPPPGQRRTADAVFTLYPPAGQGLRRAYWRGPIRWADGPVPPEAP